jgi:serine/threonine protein kinase/tetratricopeptide (TPR) repeat protein
MIAERWERIKELFEIALDHSAEERQSFVIQLAQEDHAIADQVAELLSSFEEAGDFLVQPCCLASDFLEDLEAEQQRFSPGEVLCGRFRTVHLIGRGGMGEVYKAWDEELEDHVALKTLRLEISTHELFTSRFRREIQLARKVTHPNVCRIFDSFKHPIGDGTYISVLSMELLQGQNLADYLQTKCRLTAAEALPMAQQIIAGLSAIHAAGIVHRDLKPANLVLVPDPLDAKTTVAGVASQTSVAQHGKAFVVEATPRRKSGTVTGDASDAPPTGATEAQAASDGLDKTEGVGSNKDQGDKSLDGTDRARGGTGTASFQIKITDFGIAGRVPDGLSNAAQTEVSKLLGTPDYMAPEQLEHARADIQSDIYSLGLVLYEMVTGSKPFADASAWKRTTADSPSPRKLAADLPENWNKTIACCLERNPQYRFQRAQAVLDGLEGDASAAKVPPKPLVVRLKRAARSKIGLIGIIFLLLVALAASVYRYYNQSPEIPSGTMILVTEITTSDPSLSGITVALKSQLAQSPHFEVEDDTKIGEILKQMNRKPGDPLDTRTAREVARRSGAPLVVFGSVAKNGEGYELSIKVEHPLNPLFPGARWKQSFPAENQSELLGTAVQAASSWIRRLVGEQAAELGLQDRPVEDTTTPSWLALQQYSEAEKRYSAGDANAALVLLGEAIQSDPDFAKAHMRRADIWISQRRYNEGYEEWKKAFDLVTNRKLTNRETLRIQGQYYADMGYHLKAVETFGDYKTLYPTDYLAWFYWGSALEAREQFDQAIGAFQEASLLRPASYGPREHLAALYLLLGRFDDAKRETEQVKALGSWEWSTWLNGESEFLQGNYDTGLEIVRTLRSSPLEEWQSKSFRYTANFLSEMGRLPEATLVLEQGAAFDHSHGRPPDEAEKLLNLAYLAWLQHDFQNARRRAIDAGLVDNSPAHLCDAGTLLARSGFIDEARSLLQQMPLLDIPRVVIAQKRLSGEIELAEGRWRAGVKYLNEAQKSSRPRDQQEYLAYAYATAGQQTNVANAYMDLVRNKGRIWLDMDSPFPGLWSNAVIAYLSTSIGSEDTDKCSLLRELLSIRAHAEPSTRFVTDAINSRFRPMCGG